MTNISLIVSIIAQLFAIACLIYVRKQYKISQENWKKIAKLRQETATLNAWNEGKEREALLREEKGREARLRERSKLGIKYVKPGDKFKYDNNGYTYTSHGYAVYEPRLDAYIVDVSAGNETYHCGCVFKTSKTFILVED